MRTLPIEDSCLQSYAKFPHFTPLCPTFFRILTTFLLSVNISLTVLGIKSCVKELLFYSFI